MFRGYIRDTRAVCDSLHPHIIMPSPPSVLQLLRELVVCASLSFIIILGVMHALLHLLYIYLASGHALRSSLTKTMTASVMQMSQIADAQAYILVVFKVTVACTILVLAVREIISAAGNYLGWFNPLKEGDSEAGDCKLPKSVERPDEKVALTDVPYFSISIPAPNDPLVLRCCD
ncbi:hypothetical protein B0H11DRAFT_231299 [Mycena galericulata]|nr:hypothetical protein B0H11DRAFT_231299 [Mycena galericulata]